MRLDRSRVTWPDYGVQVVGCMYLVVEFRHVPRVWWNEEIVAGVRPDPTDLELC